MKYVLLMFTLLMAFSVSIAQSDGISEPWPIVEQCITLQGTPSDDWSFDGTLVMTSQGRLHAYRDEWQTPRITTFFSSPIQDELSPDDRWYAIVEGTARVEGFNTVFTTTAIQVFDTLDGNSHTIPWESSYKAQRRVIGRELYWMNDTRLLYSGTVIDPFTAETMPLDRPFNTYHFVFELSPDTQKGLSASWPEPHWTIHTPDNTVELSIPTTYGALWHPTSEYFVTVTVSPESSDPQNIITINLNGDIEHLEYQIQPSSQYVSDARRMAWSTEGRYLAFETEDKRLFIADMDQQVVINTCLTPENDFTFAWSPTHYQLAIIDPRSEDHAIRIVDFDTSVSYIVGYHRGSIIGWRADDEE